MHMIVDGLEVQVTKKKIKNVNLYVKSPDGRVVVTAPLHVSEEQIAQFVRTKMEWIRNKQSQYTTQSRTTVKRYETGENISLWGRTYCLQVEYGNKRNSVALDGDHVILSVHEHSTIAQREKIITEWYRGLLQSEITDKLAKWEAMTGLYAASWQIRNMKTRWGSCNVKTKKIWLNLQLVKYPVDCLELVILHELLHLKVPNHGQAFVALMDNFLPEWKTIEKKLTGKVDG